MLTLGVIADTHIPDRAKRLHPKAISTFERSNLHAILHAGDISIPRIIKQLEEIAPVYAVRGNRDLFGFNHLPRHRTLEFESVVIGLTHGHGGWRQYFIEKLSYLLKGPPKFSHFEDIALGIFPQADAIVLGHNHAPTTRRQDGQLIFNPGSACCPNPHFPNLTPSVGLLHIDGDNVEGEIVFLK